MAAKAFIVEDSPAVRLALSEALLELADVQTIATASNERDAVKWLRTANEAWDLAIVDLILEGQGSGLGVLRALRERDPARQVVVLTATASPAVREQCLALGSDQVFDKAMESDALIAWCAGFARSKASESPPAAGTSRNEDGPERPAA